MLILGHTGITLGCAVMLDTVISKKKSSREFSSSEALTKRHLEESGFGLLAKHMDIRVLLIGSLLPDIIDKPLGYIILRETVSYGRIFCHSMLFLMIIVFVGIYLCQKYKKNWLLVISFGIFTHLIFDQMWFAPHILLWPLYGWSFPQGNPDILLWMEDMLIELLTNPGTYVPEIVGTLVLLIFLWQLIKSKSLVSFISRGRLQESITSEK
jgi:inner membrane protein